MQLVLSKGEDSRACDWSSYAILRDNVQHYIEGGEPSAAFAALHAVEAAVDGGEAAIDAVRLRDEVTRAWHALARKTAGAAALSLRTRAILTGARGKPTRRGTLPAASVGWRLPAALPDGAPLLRAARAFVRATLELTATAAAGERIVVSRSGPAPRHAQEREQAARVS